MNKTFQRTAFNLSAKSMLSLMLLLIAMLMPQGAWATDFISEIKVSVHEKNGETARNKLTNDGYTIVNVDGAADLNGGGGGYYVYIGYKTSTNAADAITGLLIVESNGFDAHAIDNITNANVTYNGKNYYRCANYDAGNARLDCDLNRGRTGTPDIVLFYTKDGNTSHGGTPLTSISVVGNTTTTGVTYTRHWKYGDAQNGTTNEDIYGNTNQGSGTAHYITYTTHTHAYTAAFSWATNGKTCTATVSCSCGDTHSDLACTVTSATKTPATCTEKGWTTYTAKVTSNGKDFSATKDVQDIAALGHNYGNGSWSWGNDGHSATCTRTCSNDANHKSSVSVTLGNGIASAQQVAPKCTEMGTTRYTATATVEGTQYSATKDVVDIAVLGHSYGGGVWSWADDGHSATCTRTCGRTGCTTNTTGHTSSKSVTLGNGIASAQQVAANCTQKGTTRYTATATVEGTQYNATKDIVDIAALGHLWHDDREDLCDRCNHTFLYYEHTEKSNPHVSGRFYNSANEQVTAYHSYDYNTHIGTIEIYDIVVKIYDVFDWNSTVTSVKIPHTVKELRGTFNQCEGLKSVTLYEGLEIIGVNTFYETPLTSITLPHSLKSIDGSAFQNCNNLTSIVMQSVPQVDGVWYSSLARSVVLSDDSYVYKDSNPNFPTVTSITAPCTLDLTDSAVENHPNLLHTGGQKIVDSAPVAPTCTTDGHTEGSHCDLCNKPLTVQQTIPATGHSFNNKTLTAEAVEDALYAYVCDNGCGEHNDAHVIKDYDGEGNNLELTKDASGNYTAYSVDIVDGKSFFTPVPFTSKIVTMNRTFIVGHTSDDIVPATVMLPFSIDAEELASPAWMDEIFGQIFYEFNSIIRNAETGKWEAIMTRVTDVVQAYTPYILVMMDVANRFDFGWNYYTMTFPATPAAFEMITTDAETGWTFVGLNETKRWEEGDQEIGKAYGIAGKDKEYDDYSVHRGDFVKIAAGASAKPGRCYLLKEGGILSNARGMTRAAEEEELPAVIQLRLVGSSTQGIGTINTETGEMTIEGWYDLNGNKIEEPSKGGVYIHNNKKVMLK